LLLRQDNADLRLTPLGFETGLIDKERYDAVERKRAVIAAELKRLGNSYIPNSDRSVRAEEFLRRQEVDYKSLVSLGIGDPRLPEAVAEQVEIEAKYAGYIHKQNAQVARMARLESRLVPKGIDYETISGLRHEARQKLKKLQPATLAQASRIDGVTPADLAILMVHLKR
jgi:tRNA uridine 5-carboxymethylaminomethyl modification enzyme